jgi:pimeloyl-ACP methyl ester carboxylesterase
MSELVSICGTSNPNRRGDVVFVHGLNGDARATWQPDGEPGRFWPSWLCEDFADIGVWSVGYEVSSFEWKGSTMPLAKRATNALSLLKTHEIGKDKPVVFITHSLGGLLVKEMLRKATDNSFPEAQQLAKHTRGVVFLSTPHSGSDLANFVDFLKVFRPSESVRELKPNEPRLRELNDWYRNNVDSLEIETQVYYESKPTPAGKDFFGRLVSTLVVNADSADPKIAGVPAIPMDEDHISISQPGRTSALYLSIRKFVDKRLPGNITANSEDLGAETETVSTSVAPSAGNVAINGNVVGGVILTGNQNVISIGNASTPPDLRNSPGRTSVVNPQSLRSTLNRLIPTQFDILAFNLEVPGYVMPGKSAAHGDRVGALLEWAQGSSGPGFERVQEELEKIIYSR